MTLNTEVLLPYTTLGIPSGNYDGHSTTFVGNAIPAANYYGGQGSGQTALIQSTNLLGNVTIQGTLNSWTEQALWFDIVSYGSNTVSTTNTAALNMIGNFAWLRAKVTGFTGGTINSANVIF